MAHICFFARSLLAHGMGGTERHVQLLTEGLARRGHRVTVLTTSHPEGVESERAAGVEVFYLSQAPSRRLSPEFWAAGCRAFEELHRREPVDVAMDMTMAGYGWVVECRDRWPLPFVPFFTGGCKDTLRNRWTETKGPWELVHFFLRALPEWWWGYRRWFRTVIEAADLILVEHPSLKRILSGEFGAPEEKFRLALWPADVERFRPDPYIRVRVRKRYGFSEEQPLIVMVAVLTKQKGQHVGLEAVGRLSEAFPDLGVLLVGEGPHEAALRSLAERLGIAPRVAFCGSVNPEELPAYYNAGDLFVSPTLRVEGIPCVMAEAMACATPVVASAVGGIPDVIVHGRTGRLVPPGDVARLSDEIGRLLAHPEERRALAEAALKDVHERLTVERYLDAVEETIEEAVSLRKRKI